MSYVIKNCPNCYCYGENDYWCEFEHDNTLFTNPCHKSNCLLKKIADKCRNASHQDLHFTPSEILQILEIEEF